MSEWRWDGMYKKLKPPSHDNGDIVDQTYLDSGLGASMDVKQIGMEGGRGGTLVRSRIGS